MFKNLRKKVEDGNATLHGVVPGSVVAKRSVVDVSPAHSNGDTSSIPGERSSDEQSNDYIGTTTPRSRTGDCEECSRFRSELESSKRALRASETLQSDLNERLQRSSDQIDAALRKNASLEYENSSAQIENAKLRGSIQNVSNRVTAIRERLEKASSLFDQRQKQNGNHEVDSSAMSDSNESSVIDDSNGIGQSEAQKKERKPSSSTEINEIRLDVAATLNSVRELESWLQRAVASDDTSGSVFSNANVLTKLEFQLSEAQRRVRELETEREAMTLTHKQALTERFLVEQRMKLELESLTTECETVRTRSAKMLSEAHSASGQQIDELQIQISSLRQANAALARERELAASLAESLQRSLASVERDASIAGAAKNELEATTARIASEKAALETELSHIREELANQRAEAEKAMRERVVELDAALAERNKSLRIKDQQIADLRKLLKDAQSTTNSITSSNTSSKPGTAVSMGSTLSVQMDIEMHPSRTEQHQHQQQPQPPQPQQQPALKKAESQPKRLFSKEAVEDGFELCKDTQVNFIYLKHVVLKFILSRDQDAQQLLKALSTLLRLTVDEQKLVRESLEYKSSWWFR